MSSPMSAEDRHWQNLKAWAQGKPDPYPEVEIPVVSPKPEPSAEEKALERVPEWIRCHPLFRQTTTTPDSLALWKEPSIEDEVRR